MKIAAVVAVLFALVYGALAYGQSKPGAQAIGRFAIVVGADGKTAWRVDTATGAASFCLVGIMKDPLREGRDPGCSEWMR